MLITIARFTYPYEAQIAWSKLDALGVSAYIADEHTINMQWLYSNALGGVRLQVREEDEQAALLALAEDLETNKKGLTLSCALFVAALIPSFINSVNVGHF